MQQYTLSCSADVALLADFTEKSLVIRYITTDPVPSNFTTIRPIKNPVEIQIAIGKDGSASKWAIAQYDTGDPVNSPLVDKHHWAGDMLPIEFGTPECHSNYDKLCRLLNEKLPKISTEQPKLPAVTAPVIPAAKPAAAAMAKPKPVLQAQKPQAQPELRATAFETAIRKQLHAAGFEIITALDGSPVIVRAAELKRFTK